MTMNIEEFDLAPEGFTQTELEVLLSDIFPDGMSDVEKAECMVDVMYHHTLQDIPYTWYARGEVSMVGDLTDEVIEVINTHNERSIYESEGEGKEIAEECGCSQLKINMCTTGYRLWAEFVDEEGDLRCGCMTIIPFDCGSLGAVLANMLHTEDGAYNAFTEYI